MARIERREKVTIPEELKGKLKILGDNLSEFDLDVRTSILLNLVDDCNDRPTDDLQIGVNIILRALKYYTGRNERLDILKQTLEALMEAAHKNMEDDLISKHLDS